MTNTNGAEVKKNIKRFGASTLRNVSIAFDKSIGEAANVAKQKAPWTDRTGDARNSITASGPKDTNKSLIWYLAILMSYGVYLELKNEGRYRIIWPTMNAQRNNILANVKGTLSL